MLTVKSPRRCTNSLVPSRGSTIRKLVRLWPWVSACSSVTSGISGKAARRPSAIRASAASSAAVTGEASVLERTSKSGPS